MSFQHLSYITLDSIVTDYLNESEQGQNKYYKVWQIAWRGMEDLGLDFFYQVKSVKLPVNGNKTVDIPADFLNWAKLGILNNRGEIIPLYYNDKLTTYADLSADRKSKTADGSPIGSDFGLNNWVNYWNGYDYVNIYGVPSGAPFAGDFKIDLSNGVIILNERFNKDYIMLEYVASPQEGGEYYVPLQFREALIAWVRWKDIISVPAKAHFHNANVAMREKYFYAERRKAIARWKPIRVNDMYQISQEMTRLAVKT